MRLNPAFVEWMMGLPEGWVTGLGLSRTDMLKALGNGVVPQQCQLALEELVYLLTGNPASGCTYIPPHVAPHADVRQDSVKLLLPTPRSTDRFGSGTHGDGGKDLRTTVSEWMADSEWNGEYVAG